MKKRIISMMLVISMVLMYVPTTAWAGGAGGTYTNIEGTAGVNNDEGPNKLLDGSSNTKWCVTGISDASNTDVYIIFQTSSAVNVSGYSITTGNDNAKERGRNPKNWTLYGMNSASNPDRDSSNWTEIHSVTDDTVLEDKNYQTYNYVFEKTETAYQYFKLEISEIQSGNVMQMSEFALTSCDHNWGTPIKTNTTCTNAGYESKTCSICKGEYIYNYMSKLGHSFTLEGGKCKNCYKTEQEAYTFTYLDSQGIEQSKYCKNEVKASDTNWSDSTSNGTTEYSGWYVVNSNVTINERVNVNGNVHLILADGCTLTVCSSSFSLRLISSN